VATRIIPVQARQPSPAEFNGEGGRAHYGGRALRQIGFLPSESQAQTFSDYLYSIGITNQIEEGPDAPDQAKVWLSGYILRNTWTAPSKS
jgi:hypothetical protein